jgi:tetratricopeptide (TPR) repeat protein
MTRRSLRSALQLLAGITLCGATAASGAPREQVPFGARAIGLGGAYSAVADDASTVFWNPAGLVDVGHQEIAGSHSDLYGSGLRQDVVGFVLPLTPGHAVAFDWYHQGIEDSELKWGENRLDLAYALRVHQRVSLGISAKYLTRSTELDGITLVDSRGAGLDFGVVAMPTRTVRLGIAAQDVTKTRLSDSDRGSYTAYPRGIRLGAAWTPTRRTLLALDVDDRIHAGLEFAPFEALAFRAGTQISTDGRESAIPAFGTGLKVGILKFDYALELHPDLGSTSHFDVGLAFNFNPAQVRIEKVEVREVFTSLYKSYSREPLATVRLRNLKDTPIVARVSLLSPDLMDARTEQEVILRPKASQEVSLSAVLSDKVMELASDRQVPVQVTVSYQSARLSRNEKAASRCLAYSRGAINWGHGMAQAAAFVTTRDPSVDLLARHVAGEVARLGGGTFNNRNLAFTAGVVSALQDLGMAYVPDPSNPFASISEELQAVDTIHYPRETLASRVGDCDDTTVLLSALLENLGVSTRFVDVPGHIFLIVNTGIHERNRQALQVPDELLVVEDGELWIPIETTLVGRGFTEAWRAGAESFRSWKERGVLGTLDVAESQSRYLPADLPGVTLDVTGRLSRFSELYAQERAILEKWGNEYLAARFGQSPASRNVPSPAAACMVAEVLYHSGRLDAARTQLETALKGAPASAALLNNLAVVRSSAGETAAGIDLLTRALDTERRDAGIWLNMALLRYVSSDTGDAIAAVAQGLELSGGYAETVRLLKLQPEASDRAGSKKVTAVEIRRLLRKALARVPAAPDTTVSVGKNDTKSPAPVKEPTGVMIAASRGSDKVLSEFLYWKTP